MPLANAIRMSPTRSAKFSVAGKPLALRDSNRRGR
jgi:hypothetical protein